MTLTTRYRGFVLDLDGTVYLGEELLPGSRETISALRDAGAGLLYLTNKPLESGASYADKLTALGLPTDPNEIVTSLDALVGYMTDHHPGAPVLCVSEPLVATTMAAAGFEIVDLDRAEKASAVVVAFDRTFDYPKLHAAFKAVRNGAVIVATNPDRFCPTPDGGLPDCAAMLAAVEACTGEKAEAVVGKPSAQMMETILRRLHLPPHEVLMVGDRLETDVAMARRAGVDAALTLSGATTAQEAARADPPPTFVLNNLGDLPAALSSTPGK